MKGSSRAPNTYVPVQRRTAWARAVLTTRATAGFLILWGASSCLSLPFPRGGLLLLVWQSDNAAMYASYSQGCPTCSSHDANRVFGRGTFECLWPRDKEDCTYCYCEHGWLSCRGPDDGYLLANRHARPANTSETSWSRGSNCYATAAQPRLPAERSGRATEMPVPVPGWREAFVPPSPGSSARTAATQC